MSVYEKAVFYHFMHSLGLLIVSYAAQDRYVLAVSGRHRCAPCCWRES